MREATDGDLRRCAEVWFSTQSVAGLALVDQPLGRHELRTGHVVVAEHDGEVIGFGATLTRSGVLYLADLFVVPEHQSKGAGRRLLAALCTGHAGPVFTFSSPDRRAQRLYEQVGMRSVRQFHYLDAPAARLEPWPSDVELRPADRAEVIAVDVAITGRDRAVDIDYATDLGAAWHLAMRDGACIGVAASIAPTRWSPWHPDGARIGPVAAHDPADVAPILGAVLAALDSVAPAADVVSTFVAADHDALPHLLVAGFGVSDTDLLMATDRAAIEQHLAQPRYLPSVDTP